MHFKSDTRLMACLGLLEGLGQLKAAEVHVLSRRLIMRPKLGWLQDQVTQLCSVAQGCCFHWALSASQEFLIPALSNSTLWSCLAEEEREQVQLCGSSCVVPGNSSLGMFLAGLSLPLHSWEQGRDG